MNTNTGIWKQKGKDRVVYAANMQVKRNADQWRARTALQLGLQLCFMALVFIKRAKLDAGSADAKRCSCLIYENAHVIICFCIHCVCLFVCIQNMQRYFKSLHVLQRISQHSGANPHYELKCYFICVPFSVCFRLQQMQDVQLWSLWRDLSEVERQKLNENFSFHFKSRCKMLIIEQEL